MAKKNRALICLIAGLFTTGAGNAARSVECFPGPDFQSPAGTRWQYHADPATKQGCWYVENLRTPSRRPSEEVARSARSVPTPSASERVGILSTPRSEQREIGPTIALTPTINPWFSSPFFGPTDSPTAYSLVQIEQEPTRAVTPKRHYKEATSVRTAVRRKSEQPSRVAQRKPVRDKGEKSESQHQYSISAVAVLEAAGDKPVPGFPRLVGRDLRKAVEAVGDKTVVTAHPDLRDDWQRDLYKEFLQWRLKQVAP